MITDEQLMEDTLKWLTTPELQYLPNDKTFYFLSSVHLQWRTKKKISLKQRAYVIQILNKHWKK